MKSKFERIYENYTNRFTKGGFLPGDFVKFKGDVMSNPKILDGSDEYKAKIKELIDSDKNLRISDLTSTAATNSPAANSTADNYVATIYQALPGNSATSTDNLISVPLSVLEKVADSSDEAQMKVPDSFIKATEKINHTNTHKDTADLEDDSYDKGKDYKGGERSMHTTGDMDDEFEKDSDATAVKKKKVKNESTIKESDLKLSDNLKFYVFDGQISEKLEERNISNREKLDIDRMFKKWLKSYSGGELKVTGTDPTNSTGDYYARIADSEDGVRVWDSMSYFVDSSEDLTPKP